MASQMCGRERDVDRQENEAKVCTESFLSPLVACWRSRRSSAGGLSAFMVAGARGRGATLGCVFLVGPFGTRAGVLFRLVKGSHRASGREGCRTGPARLAARCAASAMGGTGPAAHHQSLSTDIMCIAGGSPLSSWSFWVFPRRGWRTWALQIAPRRRQTARAAAGPRR